MNILLLFFALPIAVIIISIVLQKILKCPILVAGVIFAIFLIVTFVIGNINFLVATIVYTILSFITAFITMLLCRFLAHQEDDSCQCFSGRNRSGRGGRNTSNRCNCSTCCCENNEPTLLTINSSCSNGRNGDLLTISSNGCNGVENDLLTIQSNCGRSGQNNGNSNGCSNHCSNGCNWSCTCRENNSTDDNGNNGMGNNNNAIVLNANVVPNQCNNGRTGNFNGCYRRR